MCRQVELDELDDDPIRCADIGVANRAGASRRCVRLYPAFMETREHGIEVRGLNAEVRHTKPGAERPAARLGRLRRRHPRRKLTDDQELPAEQHAVVQATLARRNAT